MFKLFKSKSKEITILKNDEEQNSKLLNYNFDADKYIEAYYSKFEKFGLNKETIAVKGCRSVGKKDLVHNNATPEITVDPERYEVRVDGELITCEPVDTVPLGQRYFMF